MWINYYLSLIGVWFLIAGIIGIFLMNSLIEVAYVCMLILDGIIFIIFDEVLFIKDKRRLKQKLNKLK